MRPIDVNPKDLEVVRCILREHVPEYEVRAFGSRVAWTARDTSDLDLTLMTDEPLGAARAADLGEAFVESDLPFKVDVVDWATTKERFRRIIEKDCVVVQEAARGKPGGSSGVATERLVGPAPADWEYTTLGAACERGGGGIQTGPFGTQLHASDYVDVGIPSIMPANIGDNRIIEDGIARITPDDACRLSRYVVRKGDIVCSRRGDVERRALVREPEDGWLCGTGCLRVRLGVQGIDPSYASFYLAHPSVREWIVRHAHGATMPNLNTSILSACPFLVPPAEEQRAIAHILGTLDDKIELNRRMNETLEAMARALFKSWFVDFDPVRAKMDGGWRPGQSLPGLPAHLYDLFPDKLVPSELGEIPEGWEVKSLDEIASFQNGLALQKYRPEENAERLPVVKIAQLRSGQAASGEWAATTIKPECIIDDGDVVFSWSGSLMVRVWCGGRAALNQHLFKVTSERFPRWFYLRCTQSHLAGFQQIASGKATTMGHIKRNHLSEAKCVTPSKQVLSACNGQFENLLARVISTNIESRTLAALRDILLPKLISGELRVKDAEKLTGQAI